jgi:hypothetical protein
MSLAQLDTWVKVLINYIPQMVLLLAAIVLIRKQRKWFTVVLFITAILNIALPIGVLLSQSAIGQRVTEMQPQLQTLKTQQEMQRMVTSDLQIQNYSTMKSWLSQGAFFSNLLFAIALVIALGSILGKPADAQKAEQAPASGAEQTHSGPTAS